LVVVIIISAGRWVEEVVIITHFQIIYRLIEARVV
jgi:hypothetical protein